MAFDFSVGDVGAGDEGVDGRDVGEPAVVGEDVVAVERGVRGGELIEVGVVGAGEDGGVGDAEDRGEDGAEGVPSEPLPESVASTSALSPATDVEDDAVSVLSAEAFTVAKEGCRASTLSRLRTRLRYGCASESDEP